MMTKTEIIETIVKARKLLDPIYYATENSTDPILAEINRLMCWADSSLMDAEYEVEKLGE
jgi:hypothetical protein